MRNLKLITGAAACMLASACIFSGCSGSGKTETTAAAETTTAAAESSAAESAGTEETGTDASAADTQETTVAAADAAALDAMAKISAINPEKPEDLGTVELGPYTGLELSVPEAVIVTDEDVEGYIEYSVLPNYPEEVNDEVKEGDTVVINFVGSVDGEEFEGGKGEDYHLTIGSGAFIDGFEDGLIGAHFGETVNVNVTFPQDYGVENLNGKDAVFVVDVNSILRPRTMENLDDDFAKEVSNGEYTTMDAYRKYIKDGLQAYCDSAAREELADAALTAVMEKSKVTPTEEAIEWQKDIVIRTYDTAMMSAYGMSLGGWIQMSGQTYDQFRADLTEGATEAASRAALIYAIAEKEGLEFNDEAVKAYAEEYSYYFADVQALTESTSESELELAVVGKLVTDYIAEHSNVTYTEPESELANAEAGMEEVMEAESAAAAEETAE